MSKFSYLARAFRKTLKGGQPRCPSCGSETSELVARKYLVTSLRRCRECLLLFRVPTTSEFENQSFYQKDYRQDFVTDMPPVGDLPALLKEESGLDGSRSHRPYLSALEALGAKKGQRVLDFGCSWGYGSWQLARAGYETEGFEISKVRADYARKHLGVSAVSEMEQLKGEFDVFFCIHVLEHVPAVKTIMDTAFRFLKPGGLFLAVTPNGTDEFRNLEPDLWGLLWGEVHPNFLDDQFYKNYFGEGPHLLASLPCSPESLRAVSLEKGPPQRLPCDTWELMVAARKPKENQE